MDNKTKTLIHVSYNITWEPLKEYPAPIQSEVEKAYAEVNKKHPNEDKLKTWAARFPDVPQFQNYLVDFYFSTDDYEKAYELNEKLIREHPDYLFAKINKATCYLYKKEYDKIPGVLGEGLDISLLCPGVETFHISEVMSFNQVAILYFLETGNLEAAEARFQMLEEMSPNHPGMDHLKKQVLQKRLQVGFERYKKEEATKRKVKYAGPEFPETSEQPVFNHPEVALLYENGMHINHDLIRSILALPRQTLIADLEKVIMDSITRFHSFEKQGWEEETGNFLFHAIFLLTELRAEESLPVLLQLLRADSKVTEFWFSDMFSDILWECIYQLGQNQLSALTGFLKEPGLNAYSRAVVSEAVSQIAIRQPERRTEIIAWYEELFSFFLDNMNDDKVIDSNLLGLMVSDTLYFRGKELLPIIERLFNEGVIPHGIAGDFSKVVEEMNLPPRDYYRRELYGIFDRYDHILHTWNCYTKEGGYAADDDNLFEREFDDPETYVREQPKIGRNDPCPCGSGKKYKKCCMSKVTT